MGTCLDHGHCSFVGLANESMTLEHLATLRAAHDAREEGRVATFLALSGIKGNKPRSVLPCRIEKLHVFDGSADVKCLDGKPSDIAFLL